MPDWRKTVEKDLLDNGFIHIRTNGGHFIYSDGVNTTVVARKVNKHMANIILKQAGIKKKY